MTSSGMRYQFRCITTVVVLLSALPGLACAQTLKIYTWHNYMDPEVAREFEQLHSVSIEFSYFDSDEKRDQELAATNGRGYDLLLVNRLQVSKYVQRGWLQSLTYDDVPNRRHIGMRWSETLGEFSDYALAYFWGTMGIAYRKDLIPEGFHSWRELLQPDESLRNRLSMPAFTRGLVAMSMKSKGLSANTSDEAMIIDAGRELLEQKPFVRHYGHPMLDESSGLVTGKVWAGAFYNGIVPRLRTFSSDIDFAIPDEGGILWADYLTVSQSSDNKLLAFALLDYLNEPDVAARQASYMNLATPNVSARAHMPAQYLSDPIIHPGQDVIERSEFLEPLPPRSQKQVNIIGTQLIH